MSISDNSMAIIILCSHLCVGEDILPLEPKEWASLAEILLRNNIQPQELLRFSSQDFLGRLGLGPVETDRIKKLVERSASIAFELQRLNNMGITLVTRADSCYPKRLKRVLGKSCPPLFYCAGDLKLVDKSLVGFVGSRTVDEADSIFTKTIANRVLANGYGIVTGGAKGVDSISVEEIISNDGYAVEFVADSLLTKIKNTAVVNAVRNGKLLILSVTKPNAGFNAGIAMMRNKYIYANSIGTVVVKSEYKKGGTWSGAIENLKNGWCPEYCWNNPAYNGNLQLIQQGAFPIDISWDMNLRSENLAHISPVQLSLFD